MKINVLISASWAVCTQAGGAVAGDVDSGMLLRPVVQSHTTHLVVAVLPPNDRVGPLPGMVGLVELFVLRDRKNAISTCAGGLKIRAVDV